MSYKNLEIWKLSREIVIEIRKMSLKLPKFKQFEEGQQISRSSKGAKSCIGEGYGRRRYKADFVKFIIYTLSSNDETLDHLETFFETGSLSDKNIYHELHQKFEFLGRKINYFLQAVEKSHNQNKF